MHACRSTLEDPTVSYPAAFDRVLSIAATDNLDRHASFSNANRYVDLAAPGVSITSTYRDGGYAVMSGTSMATPHVAAVAGLVRSAHPHATVDQVETALRSTALDLGTAGRDDVFGSGRVDAAAAVAWSGGAPAPSAVTYSSPAAGSATALTASTHQTIAWAEAGGPYLARTIQRQRATATEGRCGTFSADGAAVTVTVSPVSQTVLGGRCYRWVVTVRTAKVSRSGTSGAVLVDSVAPVTSARVAGPTSLDGWLRGPTTVTLSAVAPSGAWLAFALDGGPTTPYTGPIAIAADGVHRVSYQATGGTGLATLERTVTVRIDSTAAPTAIIPRWGAAATR